MLPLSIDWEDWFQLCCPPFDHPQALDHFEDRMERGTALVLELCRDLGASATFFCLADQAARHPSLLKTILSAGHDIALHGFNHQRAFSMDKAAFRDWLKAGKDQLECLSGRQIRGCDDQRQCPL